MKKNIFLKRIEINAIFTAIVLILSVTVVAYQVNINKKSFYEKLSDRSGESIWIYDSDLYIKHVETADLNGDGTMDAIAAEYDSDYYSESSNVYAIDGTDGTTLWTYQLDDGVRSMVLGDVNNDNVMDVIAGASKGSSPSDGRVHAIDGTDGDQIWTFTPGGDGDTIGDLAIGNFNGDSYPDVAVACWDDYVYAVNGQNGNQLWSKEIGSIFVNAVSTGDVNGDGICDVAFAHSYLAGWDNYQGVLNGSDGSEIWMQTVSYKVENVLMEDIDDDDSLEAIFGVSTDDDELEIHVRDAGDGGLEWSYTIGSFSLNPDAFIFAEDIDGDEDLDLVVGNEYIDYYIYAFDGDSSTLMWTSEQLSGYARDIAFGDVTGDGNLNIIAATYDRVQVLEAINGTKTWYYSVAGTMASVGSADFDDDDILDVLVGGGADFSGSPPDPDKSVWALKSSLSPLLWEYTFGEYGNALAIGDLNGDIYMDVVTVSSLDDAASAINGENGSELWTWVGTENLYSVTTGDFNDDGIDDVAVAGADDKVTALYGNNGSVMWQFTNTNGQIYRKNLQAADLNSDGYIDVIAGCDDSIVYAINGLNGNQLWSRYIGAASNEVELAQMDDSGPLDVVVAVGSGASGKKVVAIDGSDGDILWSYNAPDAVEHVEVMDVNDDDVPDVAAAITPWSEQVIMIDGDDQSTIWTKTMALSSNVHSLAHGDLDGNDIPDVVVPGSDDDKVYALNGTNGNELWTYSTSGEVNTVAVADVDLDSILDVIAGSDDQKVYVINGYDGSLTWSYSTADDVMHIQLGDISGDGIPNIACVTFGFDGVAYAFKSFSPPVNYPPNTPSNPSPSDGQTYVDPDADLSWKGGDPNPGDTVTYDVYFGTTSPPQKIISNQTELTYDPGTMNYNTTYYWKIIAWDNHNLSAAGPIWDFTVDGPNNQPYTPSDPDPEDGATGVDINADLGWTGGDPDTGDTVTYDVYFGTSSDPPMVSSNQSGTSYSPDTMDYDTKYYWKIVSWDNHGASSTGPIWSFTTGSEPNDPPYEPSDPSPGDGAVDVDYLDVVLSWTGGDPDPGDTVVYDVYLEIDNPDPTTLVSDDQSVTIFDAGNLEPDAHYYWKIVAKDNHGATTHGPVWDFITIEAFPDLDCDGSLVWSEVPPGGTVTGSFIVENIGEPYSKLDWEISEWPEWGTWTFAPVSGTDLTPEQGPFTVNVSVIAPSQQNKKFTGDVKIVNVENSSDFCIISVTLTTPVNTQSTHSVNVHVRQRVFSICR
jgi:outer membrane protein assembly factor BamB